MKRLTIVFFHILLIFLIYGCSNGDDREVKEVPEDEEERLRLFISAAASLTDAMDEVQSLFEEEYDVDLTFNFAGSGKLAQQIQQGAPVDVFISANESWMNTLIEEGLIKEESRVDVTGNKLVLIVETNSPIAYSSFDDIDVRDVEQIAIGNPESVPAGEYTEAVLRAINKWDELENSFVYAKDVRQVLTYVETGNTELGFVYESDAMSSDQVITLAASDPAMHEAIIYPSAITASSEQEEVAKQFIDYLISEDGQKVLSKYGFNK